MKLNQIINESTDPKRPTDLTKYPLKPGNKYTANFYTGKKGVKNGKIVLGYNDIKNKNDFRTTDPVASINQSNSTPDNWLVKTLRNEVPYYYLMYMPVATMKATCGWYLKGKNVSLNLQTPEGIPKDYMNLVTFSRNARGELKSEPVAHEWSMNWDWEYLDGTMIEAAKRPAKPKNSVEAYNYLMYWAFTNSNKALYDPDADMSLKLANYLETGKYLKPGIQEVAAKYPKAKDAVIAKLKEMAKDEAPAEQQAAPAAAAQAEDLETRRRAEDVTIEEFDNMSEDEQLELDSGVAAAAPATQQFELNLEPDDEAPATQQAAPAAAAAEQPTQEAEADQTTSNAAAETTNTRSYHREFGGMPDNRGDKPTKARANAPRTDANDTDNEDTDNPEERPPRWKFEALDSTDTVVKDTIDADSEEEAREKILALGYFVTKLTDRHKPRSFWDKFLNDRSVKALRRKFWPDNDD